MSINIEQYKRVKEVGYTSNKDVKIKKIDFLKIKKFRSIEDRIIKLGNNITILIGRNGTMKTSVLGLIAHPFSSSAKDVFGEDLKTSKRNIFKFSIKYDDNYEYSVYLQDDNNVCLTEPVNINIGKGEETKRHRIVVSGKSKGEGNFSYNTSFLNLSRLYPISDIAAEHINNTIVNLNDREKMQLNNFYERIFPSREYRDFEGVINNDKTKETFAPGGDNVKYDFNSISTGEDNLGALFNKLITFQRDSLSLTTNSGNGIFCIDEIEAGLHPAAQIALFDYLLGWSKIHKVQIAFTTHSLYLIKMIYAKYYIDLKNNNIVLNFFSCSKAEDDKNYPIFYNPDFSFAYKELTLSTPNEVIKENQIKVFCEDELAMFLIKQLVGTNICKYVEFVYIKNKDKDGFGYRELGGICKTYPLIFSKIGFCVFDADVDDNYLSNIENDKMYTKIIDADKFCIEKRIAVFISELENNNSFFDVKEKDSFLQDMASKYIQISGEHIRKENDTKKFKSWFKIYTKKDRQKYIKEYVKTIDCTVKSKFLEDFKKKLNYIRKNLNLPEIK